MTDPQELHHVANRALARFHAQIGTVHVGPDYADAVAACAESLYQAILAACEEGFEVLAYTGVGTVHDIGAVGPLERAGFDYVSDPDGDLQQDARRCELVSIARLALRPARSGPHGATPDRPALPHE